MLHLADRHLVDREGVSVGKVDDLEFRDPADDEELPVLTDVLTGLAALAGRFSPQAGRELEKVRRVEVASGDPGPARISMKAVRSIGTRVQLSVARDELEVQLLDR